MIERDQKYDRERSENMIGRDPPTSPSLCVKNMIERDQGQTEQTCFPNVVSPTKL